MSHHIQNNRSDHENILILLCTNSTFRNTEMHLNVQQRETELAEIYTCLKESQKSSEFSFECLGILLLFMCNSISWLVTTTIYLMAPYIAQIRIRAENTVARCKEVYEFPVYDLLRDNVIAVLSVIFFWPSICWPVHDSLVLLLLQLTPLRLPPSPLHH